MEFKPEQNRVELSSRERSAFGMEQNEMYWPMNKLDSLARTAVDRIDEYADSVAKRHGPRRMLAVQKRDISNSVLMAALVQLHPYITDEELAQTVDGLLDTV